MGDAQRLGTILFLALLGLTALAGPALATQRIVLGELFTWEDDI